ncbi:NTP transferase domain-containing protein [Sphingomonas sinipercae]|uniref:NTP transferase domain-containing protein n=1 Tax=Sphingomonas sinipercae TaxID=2714944 RepID=A0A6G7ZLE7_9SPHN|nr:NTP transferase domain-containing protein [Sphingomonas sinipercae]QIL01763.1 NTP transferase domain-containing protein [Sphingomonas sinipercae]
MTGLTALVLAGSRPGRDAFAEAHGTDLKPLIPVGGEPMVRRPVLTLLATDGIARVLVVSQQPERIAAVLPADARTAVSASAATIAATLVQLIDDPATQWPLLVTTADHALLTSGMIYDLVTGAAGADVAIGLVGEAALMRRLPDTKRTWIRFRDGGYSGANLFLLRGPQVRPAIEKWRAVEQDRKKGLRLLLSLGPLALVGAVLRLRTLDQTLRTVGRKLGLKLVAVRMSDPLAAVDVDKDADLTLVEQLLRERA